jgi:hypothetical protein
MQQFIRVDNENKEKITEACKLFFGKSSDTLIKIDENQITYKASTYKINVPGKNTDIKDFSIHFKVNKFDIPKATQNGMGDHGEIFMQGTKSEVRLESSDESFITITYATNQTIRESFNEKDTIQKLDSLFDKDRLQGWVDSISSKTRVIKEENIKKDKLRNSLKDKMNQQYTTGFVKLIRDISTESEYRDINEEEKIRIIQTSLTESYTAFFKTINQGTINNVDHAVNQTSTRNSKLQSILNRLTKILGLQN